MSVVARHEGTVAPPEGTVERWAWDYVVTTDLAHKLAPPPPPVAHEEAAPPRRLALPGRPPALKPSTKRFKTPGPEALRAPEKRAELLHTFVHHELQAAELMCWALLAFPETPAAFKRGLVKIARDEVRHMKMYCEHLAGLGHAFGDFPVRDWFWERVPAAPSAAHFVATLGVGFEGANLDHASRFAERFRAIGDDRGAELQEQVCLEEVPHVKFALTWLRTWTGADDFATWAHHLPAPLSPMLMKGTPLQRAPRRSAGLSDAFLDELAAWQPEPSGS